jgi:dihydrofolate reductase
VTRTPVPIEGCVVVGSLPKAFETAHSVDKEEIFIFGGASLYEQALPLTGRLYLTLIHEENKDADVFFPDYHEFTHEISREDHLDHIPPFSWVTLERSNL